MQRSSERILTTHVGSLMRPEAIRQHALKFAADESLDEATFGRDLTPAVAEVVRQQKLHGIDVVSDGEYGKLSWTAYSMERISGFELGAPFNPAEFIGHDAKRFSGYYEQALAPLKQRKMLSREWVCVAPLEYTDRGRALMQRDVNNLLAAVRKSQPVEAFLPVVAPCSITAGYRNEYYRSEEEFLFALADAQHEEYKLITDAGLIVQIDDAILANLHDRIVDSGRDYRSWVQMNIAALNHALRGIPEEQVRYHLCWGSWAGPHTTDVPLAELVDLLLTINAQAYSIEAANPRHEHEWTVWQDTRLPEGKILLPGFVSHAITHVEHPELIAQRIVRFANLVGRENVIASTDCGFAQSATISRQHEDIVWAKLEALAEGARLASRRLWPQ
jgi:5-methyltetrahydropteroyltriglutamate--homocysteine methyltransferase